MRTALERALAHKGVQVCQVHRQGDEWLVELAVQPLPPAVLVQELLAQELHRYGLPLTTALRVRGDGWEMAFTLAEVLAPVRRSPRRSVDLPLYTLDATQRRILLIGLVTALVLDSIPLVRLVLSYLVITIHELGHTLAAWLMGYPAIPAFDFLYGGGVTLQLGQRWVLVPMVVYMVLVGGLMYFRRNGWTCLALLALGLIYTGLYFTRWSEGLVVAMGHGMELLLAGLFLLRALTGWACQQPGEQTLYGILGFFVLVYDLHFAWQLLFDAQVRAWYLQGKGGLLDQDVVRLAQEFLGVDLALVVVLLGLSCLVTPLVAWGLYRYQSYWLYAGVGLLRKVG
ncbi:MAG: hypothetical protein Q6L50_03400 [Gloeomargarita sp. GMQP_bins_120]